MHEKAGARAIRRASAAGRRLGRLWPRVADWRGTPHALDLVTAGGCFALMSLDIPGLAHADNALTGATATIVLALGAATLLLRRRVPWGPWLPYAVSLVFLGWLHELTLVQFALYSVARYRGRAAGVVSCLGYLVAACVSYALPNWPVHRGETVSQFLALVVPVGVLATGVGIAANRLDLVRALEAQRTETALLQAVQEERGSVAGDVHDFVGRELTMLSVRAGVLSRRARGERWEQDFDELAETARRAHLLLNEIVVRRGSGGGAPTPGLEALPDLVAQSALTGNDVTLTVDDAARAQSPLRQAAVYRVVQECLTNAAKHAPGAPVDVTVTLAGPTRLRVTVTNPLPTDVPVVPPVSAGTGTAGMAERVVTVGGTFKAGLKGDCYEVEAELPARSAP
ncbi:histidine kinase [Streptomyces sp. SID8379]|uniref:sensor histidine kinase n=1 Tax=unclassified Streptomyces TaxID=2593676 RepID=UPI0005BE8527|nr:MULTISPECIES: histidine kinase [unclassified Streptomyces]MYW65700.1 histidine kinase [Streptomyces sp. SID8379]